ncbi:squalene--hopene cyclase [Methylobacterium haplocladii]|nr:squalene--hopene cyclase [Methylobacterium haplocladii]GJD83309.1 Squalene--hopene cyclase [Methylobacterium haplocladii]
MSRPLEAFTSPHLPVADPLGHGDTLRDASATAIRRAVTALGRRRRPDGHWVFPLEADATIPADYVLLQHYLDRIDAPLQARIGIYLRRIQADSGGWPMHPGGRFDLSVSVKAYFALKAIGDAADAPHMVRARAAILAHGGAERANTFARIQLALFGAIPWHGIPAMPVEIMLLPERFVFSLWRVAYWSRTFIAPLVVLQALRPRARNPRGVDIAEIFCTPPERIRDWNPGPSRSPWSAVFKRLDALLKRAEPLPRRRLRDRAVARAQAFVEARLNGEDGLGAIYPPMAYTMMMFDALGYPADHPQVTTAWDALTRLVVEQGEEAYCQPCVSPVWDTCWAALAMAEADAAGLGEAGPEIAAACTWLAERQITAVFGDWSVVRPGVPPGGWAFQYRNDHYPDVDDTAVAGLLLHRHGGLDHAQAVERARLWIVGMQSRNGGWGAFDADNDLDILNHIPFADHGALLDPPTVDVTARCVAFLAELDHPEDRPVVARALAYLRAEQEPDGSWFGRWGTNHVYGTWSALVALRAAGLPPNDPAMRRAADWLLTIQQPDGGWGEDPSSYEAGQYRPHDGSLASQTAWAMLGLLAAGRSSEPALDRAAALLVRTQTEAGWAETGFNAVGFPRVLYLHYHGYPMYFPLLALSAFHRLRGERAAERFAWFGEADAGV